MESNVTKVLVALFKCNCCSVSIEFSTGTNITKVKISFGTPYFTSCEGRSVPDFQDSEHEKKLLSIYF